MKKSIYFDDVLAYNLYEEVCRHRYVRHRSDYADASALCECIRQCSDTRHTLGKTEDFMHRVIKTVRKPRTRDRTGGCGIDGIEILRQQSDNDVSSENGHKLRQACRCRRKDPEQRALYACNGIVDFCKYDIAFNTADKRQTVFRSVGSYKIACRTGTGGAPTRFLREESTFCVCSSMRILPTE